MATATQSPATDGGVTVSGKEASDTPIAASEGPETAARVERRGEYHCQCGQCLLVFGCGRHRMYFEPGNPRLDDPVMNGSCPRCGCGLPGKNPS